MSTDKTFQRSTFILTLVTAGVLLVGAAVIPLVVQAQQKVLDPGGYLLPPVVVDYPAPALTLTDLQGNTVSLADLRGQVVLVNNWATWCPPCKAEMPDLQVYFESHAGQGFSVVAIESGEPAGQVADFVQRYGLTFPVWLDAQGAALDAFRNWDLPSSYIIDRDGAVRLAWTGPVNQQTLEKYLNPLLEK